MFYSMLFIIGGNLMLMVKGGPHHLSHGYDRRAYGTHGYESHISINQKLLIYKLIITILLFFT